MPPHSRGLHVIAVDDERVVLKRGIREVSVSGAAAQIVVGPLLALLDGTREIDQAVGMLPDWHQQAARQVANALVARGLLEADGDGGVATLRLDDPQAAFYANFDEAGRAAADALREAHVVVHGGGLIARALLTALVELGIGRLTAVTEAGLTNPSLPEEASVIGTSSAATAIESCSRLDDLGGASLVAAASDVAQEDALLVVGRRALGADVPFLPAWLSDMTGFIGPLTHPYETACLRCYQLRVDSNATDLVVRRAMRQHTAEDPTAAASTGLIPPMASIVGQIAAVEIAKAVAGFAPSDTVGRSIEINLVSFRSSVRRVLKVPRCPDCGEVSRLATRVTMTGPQITE